MRLIRDYFRRCHYETKMGIVFVLYSLLSFFLFFIEPHWLPLVLVFFMLNSISSFKLLVIAFDQIGLPRVFTMASAFSTNILFWFSLGFLIEAIFQTKFKNKLKILSLLLILFLLGLYGNYIVCPFCT